MYDDKMETTGDVVRRLFDPRVNIRRSPVAPVAKQKYIEHILKANWEQICGPMLAKNCSIYKLEGEELYVKTTTAAMANELFMMQQLFLQKVNAYLLGRRVIKKVYFQSGGSIRRLEKKAKAEAAEPDPTYVKCPRCGARMDSRFKICGGCERELKDELRHKIGELILTEPWLTYEDCLKYYKCDRMIFTAVKDGIKNRYFEKVRLSYADNMDCLMAVMLLTEREPDNIDEKLYNNALEYLRRDQSVSPSRSRLYGEK